jgi:hypothetical protein
MLPTLKFFIFCIFHSSSFFLWFVWNMDGWVFLRCLGCLVHASINNQQFEFWLTKWICCPLFSWSTVFWNLHPTLLFGPVRFALAFNNTSWWFLLCKLGFYVAMGKTFSGWSSIPPVACCQKLDSRSFIWEKTWIKMMNCSYNSDLV